MGSGHAFLSRSEVRLLRRRHRLDPILPGPLRPALHQPALLRRDFGGKLPSEVFKEHSLACYVTDPTALKLRHEIGIDIIAWECDYPHSDCFWPDAPEKVLGELDAAGATDAEIDKITWQNSCRFFNWDPFSKIEREDATVGALRAKATDVDVSIRSRAEWAKLYEPSTRIP